MEILKYAIMIVVPFGYFYLLFLKPYLEEKEFKKKQRRFYRFR